MMNSLPHLETTLYRSYSPLWVLSTSVNPVSESHVSSHEIRGGRKLDVDVFGGVQLSFSVQYATARVYLISKAMEFSQETGRRGSFLRLYRFRNWTYNFPKSTFLRLSPLPFH